MEHKTHTWVSPQGHNIFFQAWLPENDVKAIVLMVHGLGEHSGRYQHVAEYFGKHQIAFFALDHLGHGKSSLKKGHIPSYEIVYEYIDSLYQYASQTIPNVPVFMYGHSMGGNIVIAYALEHKDNSPFKGFIVTSPGLGVGEPIPPAKLAMAKVLSAVLPSITMDNGLDLQNLSHDQDVIKAYQDDPLVHPMISARLAMNMLSKGEWAVENAGLLAKPMYLGQGSADHIVNPPSTVKFAENAPKDLVTFKMYEGLFHEIHNEPQKEELFADILSWLHDHI